LIKIKITDPAKTTQTPTIINVPKFTLVTSSLTELKEMKARRVTNKILFLFEDYEKTQGSENLRSGTLLRQNGEKFQGKQ
jgi:hypothetical protein